jgi:hypothetical protein
MLETQSALNKWKLLIVHLNNGNSNDHSPWPGQHHSPDSLSVSQKRAYLCSRHWMWKQIKFPLDFQTEISQELLLLEAFLLSF